MPTKASNSVDAAVRREVEVPLWRLYLLRAVPILALPWGIGLLGDLVAHPPGDRGMINSMLAGLWMLSLLAIRYPLQMLPLFMFEFVWKTIWLLAFGLPQWLFGESPSPRLSQDLLDIGLAGIVFGLIIPWGYVWRHYVRGSSDRWQ